jgi:hypothetical protein
MAAASLMRCDGSSSNSNSSSTAELPVQLQRPPGDIMRCLSMLLAGSAGNKQQQQQQEFVPYLASNGSSCVYRSCQLLEAYQLLSNCARSCAAAVAAAVSSSYHQQQSLTKLRPLAGSFGLFNTTSSKGSKGDESASSDDAVAAELEHLLLLGSQQLVLLLVRQGWDVLAMDGLPLGVALPLREAVARCRTNPPAGTRSLLVCLQTRCLDSIVSLAINRRILSKMGRFWWSVLLAGMCWLWMACRLELRCR